MPSTPVWVPSASMEPVPIEPPPTPWAFPPADTGESDLVAVGADLDAGTVLAAYRRGLFPMSVEAPLPDDAARARRRRWAGGRPSAAASSRSTG